MRRAEKSIILCFIIFVFLMNPCMESQAHDLYEWSYHYPASEADQNNSFGIGYSCHVKGRTTYYSWADNSVASYFGSALQAAENSWGGMINIENDSSLASWTISIAYDNQLSGEVEMLVSTVNSGYNHYSLNEGHGLLLINEFTKNYSAEEKRKCLTHELGHFWGISDLYYYNLNLNSIYSNQYSFAEPTRHDKNAMYIGQDRPWYYDANNNLKFLKKPEVFAANEWVYSVGFVPAATSMERFYIGSNGVYSSDAYQKYNRTYGAYCIGDSLFQNQTLQHDQYLASPNGQFIAKMQSDGNFVVYNTDIALRQTHTNNIGVGYKRLKLQTDGNLVIYDSANTPHWSMWAQVGSITPAVRLTMQNDGNLVAYSSSNNAIWHIGTHSSGTGAFNVVNVSQINSKLSEINGAVNMGASLTSGNEIYANQYLSSPNKKFIAKLQTDGNFVIYNSDSSIWSTQTHVESNQSPLLAVQADGNIVLYNYTTGYTPLWYLWDQAGAWHDIATSLELQNDGNLVAYDSEGTAIWWSGTTGEYGNSTFDIN